MKRAEQLHHLSREHHDSLVMAKRLFEAVDDGSAEALSAAIDKAVTFYEDELEVHFQHEERTIFAPFFKDYKEHIPLATALLKEHGAMRLIVPRLKKEKSQELLAEFAELLKNHTRIEERELFPIVDRLFTTEQFDAVVNFVPLD